MLDEAGAPMPEHLQRTFTDRGFTHLPPIPSDYGGEVRAYESSSAEGPHLWLRVECPANLNEPSGPTIETVAHLTAESALHLADQLRFLVEHHYQNYDEAD